MLLDCLRASFRHGFVMPAAAGVYAIFARDLSGARSRVAGRSQTIDTSFGRMGFRRRSAFAATSYTRSRRQNRNNPSSDHRRAPADTVAFMTENILR